MPDLLNNNQLRINTNNQNAQPPKKTKKLWWRLVLGILAMIIVVGLGLLTKVVLAINSTNIESGEKISFFEQIGHLIVNPNKELLGENTGRINILLMGIGGAGHQGAYLADTIIIASIKPSTNEIATLSLPRDLYVDIPKFGWRKINNSLAFGNTSNYVGGGEALLSSVVEEVIGEPIHYYARIDFTGFKKIVDDINGIDIMVENSFTDYEYPDYNYGYQAISFKEGMNHLDGETSLQYVRSRHGTNGEGSDFARSERQQKVLLAIKEKFFSINNILNPSRIINALDSIGDHNKTDLQAWEIIRLADFAKNITPDNLISRVVDNGPGGLLKTDTTADGAYILLPSSGDYGKIHYLFDHIFDTDYISQEEARIEIQNSTPTIGLASQTSDRLEGMSYNIVKIGNAQTEEAMAKTTIYDLSGGTKPYTLVSLKKVLPAQISSGFPPFLTNSNIDYNNLANSNLNSNIHPAGSNIDILIILGADLVQTTTLINN